MENIFNSTVPHAKWESVFLLRDREINSLLSYGIFARLVMKEPPKKQLGAAEDCWSSKLGSHFLQKLTCHRSEEVDQTLHPIN